MTTKPSVAVDVEAIAARRKANESLASIARDFGVTRERIRQVLQSKYGTTWSDELRVMSATEKENQVAEWREKLLDRIEAGESVTREDVVDECPVPVRSAGDVLGEYAWAVAFPQQPREVYEDADIYRSIKQVWSAHIKPAPMTAEVYDEHRVVGVDVSSARITQRMAWSEACEAAGVPCGEARREVYTSLSPETALEWVTAFLADAVEKHTSPSARAYDTWARKHGAPSMGSVRAAFDGLWNNARRQATPAVIAWQRGHTTKPQIPSKTGTGQYTPEQIAEWKAARKKDPSVSIRSLAATFGVADSTLRYHLEP